MENSTDDVVKRMTWLIQQFATITRHMSGPRNYFADFISRAHPLSTQEATINGLFHNLYMTVIASASQQLFLDNSNCSPTEAILYSLLAANHADNREAIVNSVNDDTKIHALTRAQKKKLTFEPTTFEPQSSEENQNPPYKDMETFHLPKGGKDVVDSSRWNEQLRQWKDEGEEVLQRWSQLVAKAHNNGH